MEEKKQENTTSERSWGQAISDVAGGILSGMARGGKYGAIAGGLEAALNTEEFRDAKDRRVRAARIADAQLRGQRLSNEMKERQLKWSEEDRELDKESKKTRVESEKIDLQNKRDDQPVRRELNKQRVEEGKLLNEGRRISNQQNLLRLREMQDLTFKRNYQRDENSFVAKIGKDVGADGLNLTGQAIFKNSIGLKETSQLYAVWRAFNRSPEEGKYAVEQAGMIFEDDPSGKSFGFIVSSDGKRRITLDEKTLRGMTQKAATDMRYDLTAAIALGGDARNMNDYYLKNVLPGTDRIFGSYGSAVKAHRDFINGNQYEVVRLPDGTKKTFAKPRFSEADKLGHVLSVNVSAAILDGKISPEEERVLTPLFASYVKKFGGSVIFGKDIATTKVKLQDGTEVGLPQFANALKERDVVMHEWQRHLNSLKAGNGEGGGEQVKPLTQEERNYYIKSYGEEFRALDPEVANKIKEVEASILNKAYELGVRLQDENKKGYINPQATLSELAEMADEEKKIFKSAGMESLAKRGQFRLLYEKRKAEEAEDTHSKIEQKSKKTSEEMSNAAKSANGSWFTRSFAAGPMYNAASNMAFIAKQGKKKKFLLKG